MMPHALPMTLAVDGIGVALAQFLPLWMAPERGTLW